MENSMKIKRVAIVGGGTAGWLAANHLGVEIGRDPDIEITLIESPNIPIIGVGEGTVPQIKATLKKFGVSEADLLNDCDATFKQGIKFSNWMSSKKCGENNFYYHPFSSPYPSGYDVTNYWLNNRSAFEFSKLSEIYSIAELKKCPKQRSSPPYLGVVDYAYHFNAKKFSNLLAKNAREKFSVNHLYETISRVTLHPNGSIKSLVYDSGQEDQYDFYIDCSGFRSILIGDLLRVPFLDRSAQVLTDTALALQEPISETEEIFPYTLATAHEAGWIWDIPLTQRRGVGFVYSSRHMIEVDAVGAFSKYIGRDLQNSDLRKVPMTIGYRESFWKRNCVALGLAQGFVEPLEATSILVTDFSAQLIAKNFPKYIDDIPVLAAHCNKAVRYTWDRVIDFIQLHYLISNRRDSLFWIENTEGVDVSDVLRERLDMWKIAHPKRTDFFSAFDIFGVENYLFVLYGMNYSTRPGIMSYKEELKSRELIGQAQEKSMQMGDSLMSHRLWLDEFKKAINLMHS